MPTLNIHRVLPFTSQELFDLVADIEEYPAFVPWCDGITIISKTETEILADVEVGYKGIKKTYRSQIYLTPITTIKVTLVDGPFTHLNQQWQFVPHTLKEGTQGCEIKFDLDFKLKSMLLNAMAKTVCMAMSETFIQAFIDRAKKRRG